jgi:hypothetical protein
MASGQARKECGVTGLASLSLVRGVPTPQNFSDVALRGRFGNKLLIEHELIGKAV